MVICIVALAVFSVMGLFSSKYKKLAAEAFECTGKSLIMQPCTSQLDQRIKMKLTNNLIPISKRFAKFVYKYFRLLSWIFTVAFFASMLLTLLGLYNFVATGNCEPGAPSSACTLSQASSLFGLDVSSPISRLFVVIGAAAALILLAIAVSLLIRVLSRD